eukprot:5635610-Pyramimonas_sp.AAC.1
MSAAGVRVNFQIVSRRSHDGLAMLIRVSRTRVLRIPEYGLSVSPCSQGAEAETALGSERGPRFFGRFHVCFSGDPRARGPSR